MNQVTVLQSNSFGFNAEDLEFVLMKNRKELSSPCIDDLLKGLNLIKIEESASDGNNLDEQTELAYAEATQQLKDRNII